VKTGRLGKHDDGRLLYVIGLLAGEQNLRFPLRPGERALMGREVEFMLQRPDVDLGHFESAERSVSRTHAMLDCTLNGLQITDLNSANGTFVNGKRLAAFETEAVHDGDQLRFGQIAVQLRAKPIQEFPKPERPRYVPRRSLAIAK
jgi:pSer/pThr/pTyr-binding forkhead associated (FHA) protein